MREISPATRLNPSLPADVDYVLRRALREEPEERYVSVEAFAADVRAMLESRPVEARSGDAWYRTRKFVSRHWLPMTAVALVLLSFGVGLYTTNRERATALRRFTQVRQLANQFIALDADIRNLPGSVKARNRIVSESLKYLDGLGAEGRDDPDLTLEIGNAYLQVARVQGVPASVGNLGNLSQAEESLQHADRLVDAVLTARPNDRRALLTSAEIGHDRMTVADYQDRRDEALAHAREAAADLSRVLGSTPTPAEVDAATHIYSNIATSYYNSEQYGEAIAFSRRALEISKGIEAARMSRATALGKLSEALEPGGDLDEALEAIQESRTILEELAANGGGTAQQINLIIALTREGTLLGGEALGASTAGVGLDRPDAALVAFQRAVDLAERLAETDPQDYRSRRTIATASQRIGAIVRHSDPRRALAVYDHALARLQEVAPNARSRRDAVLLLAGSSYAARALHQPREAKRRIDDAFRLLRETKQYPVDRIQPGKDEPYAALRALGDHHMDIGQPEQAVKVYEELLAGMMAWKSDPEHNLFDAAAFADTWLVLSEMLRHVGRDEDARVFDGRRTELWRKWDEKHPNNPFVRRQLDIRGRP
jgi:tetratricopeptide (TPR) repeat protein